MNADIPDHVDEYRAAVLLGMPQSELRRYSRAGNDRDSAHSTQRDQGERNGARQLSGDSSAQYAKHHVLPRCF